MPPQGASTDGDDPGGTRVTVVTLLGFTAIGLWYSRGTAGTAEEFIAARNSTGTRRTTATLVASVMGAWILLAAPEAGASLGIAAIAGYAIGEMLPMAAYATPGPRITRQYRVSCSRCTD